CLSPRRRGGGGSAPRPLGLLFPAVTLTPPLLAAGAAEVDGGLGGGWKTQLRRPSLSISKASFGLARLNSSISTAPCSKGASFIPPVSFSVCRKAVLNPPGGEDKLNR